jgi:hypothetical protein
MILPGETEAGNAGTQACRGIAWRAYRDDERGKSPFALFPQSHRIERPRCLETPRPNGGILTESALSPFQAKPTRCEKSGRGVGPQPFSLAVLASTGSCRLGGPFELPLSAALGDFAALASPHHNGLLGGCEIGQRRTG